MTGVLGLDLGLVPQFRELTQQITLPVIQFPGSLDHEGDSQLSPTTTAQPWHTAPLQRDPGT